MSVEINIYSNQGFIGAGLNWNVVFTVALGDYWGVCFLPGPSDQSGSLTINSTASQRNATGAAELFVNFTNNTANDITFGTRLINIPG